MHPYKATLTDSHMRYPFAHPLRAARAKSVCQCFIDVFAQVGVPSKITSDQDTCFTAEITTNFLEMFGCSPVRSTPLHQEGNSLVERLNQTFTKTLAHVCKSQPKQWHGIIPIVLWCIRESKNQTLGNQSFHDDYGTCLLYTSPSPRDS